MSVKILNRPRFWQIYKVQTVFKFSSLILQCVRSYWVSFWIVLRYILLVLYIHNPFPLRSVVITISTHISQSIGEETFRMEILEQFWHNGLKSHLQACISRKTNHQSQSEMQQITPTCQDRLYYCVIVLSENKKGPTM